MRLIDADVLIKRLKRNSIFEKVTDSRGMNTIEIIEEQPTAYDVENVVAKLEEQKSNLTDWAEDKAFEIGIEKAIEVVKNGGI